MGKLKSQINELLNCETKAAAKINDIASVSRWKWDGLGNKLDRFEIGFHDPIGARYFFQKEIKSRDAAGVIEEIALAYEEFAEMWKEETVEKIRTGHFDLEFFIGH